MLPSVDLPAPLGPMMACTWPGFTSSERPLRISLPATLAWRFSILSMGLGIRDWGFGIRDSVFGIGSGRRRGPEEGDTRAVPGSPDRPPEAAASADAAFERDFQQLLGLHRELHGQLAEDLLAEAVDDQRDRVLLGDAAAAAVEQLVLADLGGGGLVLDRGAGIPHLDVGEGVGTALLADQQAVALGVVAR